MSNPTSQPKTRWVIGWIGTQRPYFSGGHYTSIGYDDWLPGFTGRFGVPVLPEVSWWPDRASAEAEIDDPELRPIEVPDSLWETNGNAKAIRFRRLANAEHHRNKIQSRAWICQDGGTLQAYLFPDGLGLNSICKHYRFLIGLTGNFVGGPLNHPCMRSRTIAAA